MRICLLILSLTLCACSAPSPIYKAQNLYEGGNYQGAVPILKKLANKGDVEAQYALGYMYYYGLGLPKDQDFANLWIVRSAEGGHPSAQKANELMASDKTAIQPYPWSS